MKLEESDSLRTDLDPRDASTFALLGLDAFRCIEGMLLGVFPSGILNESILMSTSTDSRLLLPLAEYSVVLSSAAPSSSPSVSLVFGICSFVALTPRMNRVALRRKNFMVAFFMVGRRLTIATITKLKVFYYSLEAHDFIFVVGSLLFGLYKGSNQKV